MPGIIGDYRIDDVIDDLGNRERGERSRMIRENWQWRDGDHPNVFKPIAMQHDDNIKLNLVGQVVEDIAEFMGTPEWVFDGDRDLFEAIAGEDFDERFADVVESGLVSGHVFIKLMLPRFGEMSVMNPPRWSLVDPEIVSVYWDSSAFGVDGVWYRLQWTVGEMSRRQDIVQVGMIGDILRARLGELLGAMDDVHWCIIEYVMDARGNWVIESADYWAFEFAPIVDWKNDRRAHKYYGEAQVKQVIGLNAAVNFVASNTGKIIKHHADPKLFVFGDELPAVHEVGGVFDNLNDEARAQLIEMSGDLQSSMQFLTSLRSSLFTQARVVDMTSMRDKVGVLTNFGVRVLYSSMVKLVENKRKAYGKGFKTVFKRMMLMMGVDGEIEAVWGDPLPIDRLEILKAIEIEDSLGIGSKTQFARLLGRDYDDVVAQRAEDARVSVLEDAVRFDAFAQGGLFGGVE